MKKQKVLVLGAGKDLNQRLFGEEPLGPLFSDNFEEVVTVDIDYNVKPTYICRIEGIWPQALRQRDFDEVHAYEALSLVGAGASTFFAGWRNIWEALKPDAHVFATTPWWQSVWAFQDPGTGQVYSTEKLHYLSQDYYKEAMTTGYNKTFWRAPYNFKICYSQMRGADPRTAGFAFVLQKESHEPDTSTTTNEGAIRETP